MNPLLKGWITASVVAAAVAWFVNQQQEQQKGTAAVYVIGDLHGDVDCARRWVERTGLILDDERGKTTLATKTPPLHKWVGHPDSHLVFLGDYIDKGITSRQTVEYVKELTDAFPGSVTALMGNHELELLRDRSEAVWGSSSDHAVGFFQLSYATVHPAEYLNYLLPMDHDDDDIAKQQEQHKNEIAVQALYNASLKVYARGHHQSVFMTPNLDHPGSILHLMVDDPPMQALVQERLTVFQKAYLNTFSTGTTLGNWLEQRPAIAIVQGTLFVHGGLSRPVASFLAAEISDTKNLVTHLNDILSNHTTETKLGAFLREDSYGQVTYDLLTYRGNHADSACDWLAEVLPKEEKEDADTRIRRLAVGHTPGSTVRLRQCNPAVSEHGNGKTTMTTTTPMMILALDSSLSRWFRNSGNEYCRGDHTVSSPPPGGGGGGGDKDGEPQYTCRSKVNRCQGQIVRIEKDRVEVLELQ